MALIALLLDLANIFGGFLLASLLLRRSGRVGDDIARGAAALARYAWIIGVVALATGLYFLLVHATSGPRVFHFEIVGILVGVALLWDRLAGRSSWRDRRGSPEGTALVLAIFGIVAIIVGIQGLLTPDG